MSEIFVSYSRKDKDVVFPLIEHINKELKLNCWIDLKGIKSGEVFEEVIIDNIDNCQVVLFMLSDASLKSKYTKREVYYAEDEGKRIVPVLIDGDKLRGWFKFHFGNVDYIDIRFDEQKDKLIRNLKSWLAVKEDGQDIEPESEQDIMSPHEQYQLGEDYYYGDNGKSQDYVKAIKWYRKAANQGDSDAQYNLGYMYYNGQGVEQDYIKALEWYRKAANQGFVPAQHDLGYMYNNGLGVEQDYKKAVEWYRKAADQGDAQSQYDFGCMYYKGYGVEQDYPKAVEWYRKAADQGDVLAQHNLGVMYYNGLGVEQDYEKAVEWYRKAADQGDSDAQYNLGCMYRDGEGVKRDYEKAVEWFRRAADQGDSDAVEALKSLS